MSIKPDTLHYMQKLTAFLLSLFFAAIACAGQFSDVEGFWLIQDTDNGNKPESIVYVYQYGGAYYCKMVAIYDENTGKIDDTIAKPKERADGISGKPFLCGLDFIWGLKPSGGRLSGSVIDPSSGSIYDCYVWYSKSVGKLAVRGEWFIFGQTQYWVKIAEKDIGVKSVLDVKGFKPNIPNSARN